MKTTIFYTVFFFSFFTRATAQEYFYTNGSFDNWKDTLGYQEPLGWSTLNSLSAFGLPQSTTLVADAHSGPYAALLVTQENSFRDFPGLLSSGLILDEQGEPDLTRGKVPFTMRPKNFSLHYKAMPAPGDSCSGFMLLTRWNLAEEKTDTIGLAGFYISDSVTNYTELVAEFDYYSPLAPDSAFIIILSSADGFNPIPGSTLYVDDFRIGFATGISETARSLEHVETYPNPVTGLLTISTKEPQFTASLTDLQGRTVYTSHSLQPVHTIETGLFKPGIYLLETRSVNGTDHRKVIVNR